MANEKKKITDNPLLNLIMRLLNVYLAATFFFKGLQDWSNGELLLTGVDLGMVILEIGFIFNWINKDSKILRFLMFAAAALALICLVFSKIYN